MAIATTNPATGLVLRAFEPLTPGQIEEKVALAAEAFLIYRKTSFQERSSLMLKVADVLEAQRDALARLASAEMGKTYKSALAEVDKCAWVCRHYAQAAEQMLADEVVEGIASHSYVRHQPLGPILVIMPWNYPFWQAFRFIAPGLMAGNVGLLKHASCVPQCALRIEEILLEAGFPEGVFQTLLIGAGAVEPILNDPRIKAATLTGSEQAGVSVAVSAAKGMKKVVMELGGSDPFIVMPSADIKEAAAIALQSRMLNNGQSCINAKRFILANPIAEEFENEFVRLTNALKVGDPVDPATDIGPLCTPESLIDLDEAVQASIRAGARLVTGGHRLDRPGNYYAPTVLSNIPTNAPAYHEELFGPVACMHRVPDIDEAIRIANDTRFGLGASVWTNDRQEQNRFIDELEVGMVFVNRMVISDPRLPFGGVKMSGHGRELGVHGIREFTNVKTVSIQDKPTLN